MVTHVFRTPVPPTLLYTFLDQFCIKTKTGVGGYLLDATAFRKLKYHSADWWAEFVAAVKPHYYVSQYFYCERPLTYNGLATIIRQICKSHGLICERRITYSKCDYNFDLVIPLSFDPSGV